MSNPLNGTSLCDIIDAHRRYRGDTLALIDDAGAVTWTELFCRISAMAAGLLARGVRRGDRVVVADEIGIDYVALYCATARIGAVLVPLNWRVHRDTIRSFINRSSPAVLLTGRAHSGLVESAPGATSLVSTDATWGDQLCAGHVDMPPANGDIGDPHLIIFTSGTTGVPKAAVLSQRATLFDAYAGALASGLGPGDRFFVYQAPYHGGTWALIRQYLLVGGSVVLTRGFDADRALSTLAQYRCTSFFAVPLVLNQLVESDTFAATDVSSLRHIVFAGYDPSSSVGSVMERLRTRAAGLTFEHIYGQTENSSLITTSRPRRDGRGLDAVGTPVPGVVVSLRDAEGLEVGPGETGEVCVRSQSVMDGYLDDAEATAQAIRGGWLHTGDLGRFDIEGMLHIVGRLKEMIRTAGVNVYPREVAAVLGGHPAVRDCAVFGVPDPRYDERVVAAVVSSDPGLRSEAVIRWVRQRMAGYQTPRQVLLLDALPKTAAGKTATAELVALAEHYDQRGGA